MILKRCAGVLAHPTSFPGPFGIGDLGKGAYDFVDFLHKGSQKLWQVLPLGPTSFGDSPYQSFSTFAGNSLLISPTLLVKEGLLAEEDLERFPAEEFDPEKIDYGKIIPHKAALYQKAFQNFQARIGDDSAPSKKLKTAYSKFCKENNGWLEDYALFVALKNYFIEERKESLLPQDADCDGLLTENQANDFYYGAVWCTWPSDIAKRNKEALDLWRKKLASEIEYYKFLQYTFFKQWFKLKEYANNLDISIIGDLPIFASMDSADVWANSELFHLDEKGYPKTVAGVPPDYFSATGQLWGNPLYNWQQHKASGYDWWIKRVRKSLQIVDVLRIDHFRGFDAYWAIPFGEATAVNGTWKKGPGRALFVAFERALGKLPIIAEDLGVMTVGVERLRDGFKFPGMKILQFAFEAPPDNAYLPHNFTTANSVVYTGTHDNDTTLGWYQSAAEEYRDYFRRYMNVSGNDPTWDLIRLAYASVAAYAIIPIQDLMNLDSSCRMNVPGVAAGNWQFRYREDMLADGIAKGLSYLSKMYNR